MRLENRLLPLSALAGLCLFLCAGGDANAGPTIKKRTWSTLQGTATAVRLAAWGAAAGGASIRAPACPAGETFLLTDVHVTPSGGRYVADRSMRPSAGLAELGNWSAHIQTDFGPAQTTVRGRGASDVTAQFPAGLPVPRGFQEFPVEVYAEWPAPAVGAPVLMAVEYRITLSGGCGLALGSP